MKYEVKDGVRTLVFDGTLLATSSSRETGKPRWIEFDLYRTNKNQYVISRVGVSKVFHDSECFTVSRNKLSPVDGMTLDMDYIPCRRCNPSRSYVDGVFPETPRHAAWVCTDAIGVVGSLMQDDENGTEYLTNVARRLLQDASQHDPHIDIAFRVDYIE